MAYSRWGFCAAVVVALWAVESRAELEEPQECDASDLALNLLQQSTLVEKPRAHGLPQGAPQWKPPNPFGGPTKAPKVLCYKYRAVPYKGLNIPEFSRASWYIQAQQMWSGAALPGHYKCAMKTFDFNLQTMAVKTPMLWSFNTFEGALPTVNKHGDPRSERTECANPGWKAATTHAQSVAEDEVDDPMEPDSEVSEVDVFGGVNKHRRWAEMKIGSCLRLAATRRDFIVLDVGFAEEDPTHYSWAIAAGGRPFVRISDTNCTNPWTRIDTRGAGLWIMSRKPQLKEEEYNEAIEALHRAGYSHSKLRQVDHEGCDYADMYRKPTFGTLKCPEPIVLDDIDMTEWSRASWYVQETHLKNEGVAKSCVVSTFDQVSDDKTRLTEWYEGKPVPLTEDGAIPQGEPNPKVTDLCYRKGKDVEGKFTLAPCVLPLLDEPIFPHAGANKWVIGLGTSAGPDGTTQYDWAIVSSGPLRNRYEDGCSSPGLRIISREPIMSTAHRAAAYVFLESRNIATSHLSKVDHTDCEYPYTK